MGSRQRFSLSLTSAFSIEYFATIISSLRDFTSIDVRVGLGNTGRDGSAHWLPERVLPESKRCQMSAACGSFRLGIEEESKVLRRARQGDEEALARLYMAYHSRVLWLCRRFFLKSEDAEDAAAEVFLKLQVVLKQHDPERRFFPWLLQVAGHHCIDKLRRQKLEKKQTSSADDLASIPDSTSDSPLTRLLRREQTEQVRRELERLPDKYRQPLILRFYDEMNCGGIAAALGIPRTNIRLILFRARKELRRRLVKYPPERGSRRLAWLHRMTHGRTNASAAECAAD